MEKISINNYKSLDNVEISGLKRVNLFTGKNNTGKSSILEAISLFASNGDLDWLGRLLISRGEFIDGYSDKAVSLENNINILSSFFRNRKVGFGENDFFKITSENGDVTFRFVKFVEEEEGEKDEYSSEILILKRKILTTDLRNESVRYGLEVKPLNNHSVVYDLDKFVFKRRYSTKDSINFHLIDSQGGDNISNARLWDKITLSEKEELVIEALKIIEPNINRLSFVGDERYRISRYPIVKLSTAKNIYPLKAMGDGINRILNLTLALVNSDGGFLLIDEFENGLHYSVQEKLWEIIFQIATKLDVQVFVTTHSNDSINSFAKVLERNDALDGSLYRLARKGESVTVNPFSKEEITEAANQGINLR